MKNSTINTLKILTWRKIIITNIVAFKFPTRKECPLLTQASSLLLKSPLEGNYSSSSLVPWKSLFGGKFSSVPWKSSLGGKLSPESFIL
jgi:hypothetical protein